MALFIGRLPFDVSNRELEDLFSKYGKITRLDIKRGFGFLEFEDKRDAEDAMKGVHGKELGREPLIVEWAKSDGVRRMGDGKCFSCGKEGNKEYNKKS
ncbi:splicing factor, arginine/serine-rich 4 [Phycomyces blakesleeanus]